MKSFPSDKSGVLFNRIMSKNNLKNDCALSAHTGIATSDISKIRNGHKAVSAEIIIKLHLLTGMSIATIYKHIKSEA